MHTGKFKNNTRTIDKDYTDGKISGNQMLNEKYQKLINEGADIIEADLGIEAGRAIERMQEVKNQKHKYFKCKSEKC